jgi:isopenicillin N synthase-like dioxygenase
VGFCYLSGHDVAAAVEQDAVEQTRAFFALGTTVKQRLSIGNSPHFRGYTPFGAEITRGRPDWREQLDLGADEPTEADSAAGPAWKRLRGPNQWPAEQPALRVAIGAWASAMDRLALSVLRALAVGLGQPRDYFDRYMLPRGDPHLKLIRYRSARSKGDRAADPSNAQGVGWHHDSGVLTFVLQDDTGGLEVRADSGIVAADPRAGTYLMNVGEMLQRATAGFLRATQHRVISPPSGRERISLAYFPHPKLESVFEPMPLPAAMAALSGRADDPMDPIHGCFGDNYLKIRLRSHPDVASRFYSDVGPTATD